MGALGGGLGGNGEVCGAVVGALGVLGLRFGRGTEEEKEDPKMFPCAKEVLQRFREIVNNHEGILCREIAGVDSFQVVQETLEQWHRDQDLQPLLPFMAQE